MLRHFKKSDLVLDDRYRFRSGDCPEQLRRSLRRDGVLTPLIGFGDSHPAILDGFRRLDAIDPAQEVAVHVMGSEPEAFLVSVGYNMIVSPYTELERAAVVDFAVRRGLLVEADILNQLLPILGFKGQKAIVDSCMAAMGLFPPLLEVLVRRKAPLKFVERLSRESVESQEVLQRIFSGNSLTLSQLIQVHDLMFYLRKTTGTLYEEIEMEIQNKDVIDELTARRYPRLQQLKDEIRNVLRPYRNVLTFPEDLEGRTYHFEFDIASPKDVEEAIEKLQTLKADARAFAFLKEYLGHD